MSAAALEVIKINQLDGSARAFVVGKGRTTGHEHLAVYDEATGEELGRFTNDLPGRVAIPQEVKDVWNDKERSLVLLHNHPDSVSLSPGDLSHLSHVGVARVVAFGHDHKSTFSATRGTNSSQLSDFVVTAGDSEARRQIFRLAERGLWLDDYRAHLLNMALDRAGIIRYESKLDAKRNKVYIKEKAAIDAAVDEIVNAITRARP
ncbi:hypothetical protein FACS189488_11720 [Betaproteobacteria bacterium]|nr:hypothetical protein FACS189488_11720 [Betaproteobacteria bacterium]